MILRKPALFLFVLLFSVACTSDSVISEREELMEGVRDALKPVGAMLKGDADFDADRVSKSLAVFADAADKIGDLVPAGSEGGEASPAIWEDPEGFAAEIAAWQKAVADAIEASPQTLEDTQAAMKPIYASCKGCHDGYRIEDD